MGVAIRNSFNRLQGHTDELVDWITMVRVKKNSVKRLRRKNLMMEAVLTSALAKAETELRVKQQQRYQRWQRLKMDLYKTDINSACNIPSSDEVRSDPWDEKICEDINSLNSFMSLLKEVKRPLQR